MLKDSISIRPARAEDRPAMVAITRNVWDGNDYVPFVWDEWLSDKNGVVMTAVVDDEVVGLQHAFLQDNGCVWLEGIRVAEDRQSQGVGRHLLEHGIEWARLIGAKSVRLSTSSGNPSSNRICEKVGLSVVRKFVPARPIPESSVVRSASAVRLASTGDYDPILCFVIETLSAAEPRFYTQGWTAYELTKQRLRLLLARQSVVLSTRGDTIDAIAITTASAERSYLRIGLLEGSLDPMANAAFWIYHRALDRRIEHVRALIPQDSLAARALALAGFDVSVDSLMLLHELRLGPD